MNLTEQNKKYIDSLSYRQLLSHWRFAPVGDVWFQGETGDYWSERMKQKEKELTSEVRVGISKSIGWGR